MEGFVRIRDYDIARSRIEHCNGRILFQRSQDIAARDHPDKLALGVHYQQRLMAADAGFAACDLVSQFADPGIGSYKRRLAVHSFAHQRVLKNVDLIFLMDAQSPPGQLFGHDGSARHEQHGYTVRNHADQHERQHRVVVASDLKSKNDEGERRSRGRAENCSHRHQCKGTRRKMCRRHQQI